MPATPSTGPMNLSVKNNAVLVTGAHSAGLGNYSAIKYAALGANPLIPGVRTREKREQAEAAITLQTGRSPDIFIIETLDLATFVSVKDFVDRVNLRLPAAAASTLSRRRPESPHGPMPRARSRYELSRIVDVLLSMLLMSLLLPKLRAKPISHRQGEENKP